MKITAKVKKLKETAGKTAGFATICFDDVFVVENISIVQGKDGLFLSYPSRKLPKPDENGKEYRDIAYPVNKEIRSQIQETVLAEFEKQ